MEYVSPEGLRLDGRRPKEVRQLRSALGVLDSADGSAMFEMGNTKARRLSALCGASLCSRHRRHLPRARWQPPPAPVDRAARPIVPSISAPPMRAMQAATSAAPLLRAPFSRWPPAATHTHTHTRAGPRRRLWPARGGQPRRRAARPRHRAL